MDTEIESREQVFRKAAHCMINQIIREYEMAAAWRMVVSWIFLAIKYAMIGVAFVTGGVLTALALYLQMVYFSHFYRGKTDEERIISGVLLLFLQFVFLGDVSFPVLCLLANAFDLGWVYFRQKKEHFLKTLYQIVQAKPQAIASVDIMDIKEDTEEIQLKLTEGIVLTIHIENPPLALQKF